MLQFILSAKFWACSDSSVCLNMLCCCLSDHVAIALSICCSIICGNMAHLSIWSTANAQLRCSQWAGDAPGVVPLGASCVCLEAMVDAPVPK